jgi:glycosyltransferase involved in cell wall biosynthesis
VTGIASTELPRVLVLSKRQYMGRDLIDERYGRFWELPKALAALGHAVRGLSLSYRPRPDRLVRADGVDWDCVSAHRALPLASLPYWRAVDRARAQFRPDVVWACSDVPHAALGVLAARRLGARLVIDLYDNFESYPLSRIPGINVLLGNAVRASDGVSVVSDPLREHVLQRYRPRGPVVTIENAVPPALFQPHDRITSRAELGLPPDGLIIGTAGAISAGRGIQYLIDAFRRFVRERPNAMLVLAGPSDGTIRIPSDDARIRYLGSLAPAQVPRLLSSLDLAVVCNRDSAFGRFCFPQKFYEALACRVPVAVANVGAMAALLQRFPEMLFQPDDAASLYAALSRQCDHPTMPPLEVPTWPGLARELSRLLQRCSAR